MASLHLMVFGGLCSRFRAVVGGSAYCDATGKDLVVHWQRWDDSKQYGRNLFPITMSELWDHPYTEVNVDQPRFSKDATALADPGDVHLRTCHLAPFVPYMRRPIGSYLGRFQVKAAVQEMVSSVIAGMQGPTVGVILRWCDRSESTPQEPPEWFVDRMGRIVDVCPGVRFYLAADCVEVDELIHGSFPDRVTALKHGTDYKYDWLGVTRTLIDLYIVAACDWVLGSRRSSYSQMAAFMRGAERVGSIRGPNSTRGGRYEAPDNQHSESDLLRSLGVT